MDQEELYREDPEKSNSEAFGKVQLKLDGFEGPFDVLLSLIEKQKMEITEISISQVTDQYLDVIFAAGGFNVEIGSEFLVMAAMLVHMKTRKLLPQPQTEEEEMTEAELAEHLELYKKYKQAAEDMAVRYEFWSGALYRAQETIDFPKLEQVFTLAPEALAENYERVKLKLETTRNDNTEKMEVILKTEKVSLREKIRQVIDVVKKRVKVRFSEIFTVKKNSKPEVVTGFLAMLELNRRDKVSISQDRPFGEIEITKKSDDLEDTSLDLEEYDEWNAE